MKFPGLIVVALFLAGAAHAGDTGQALAQKNVCLSCHQVDVKRVGPSFRDIGIRYAGSEGAVDYLANTIRDGSRRKWGAIPMPAQRHVDAASAVQLAEWILSLAPAAPGEAPEAGIAQRDETQAAESQVMEQQAVEPQVTDGQVTEQQAPEERASEEQDTGQGGQ